MNLKILSLGFVGLSFVLAGCHKQVAMTPPPSPAPTAVPVKAAPTPAAETAPVRSAENNRPAVPDAATKARIQDLLNRIQDVYFDYDRHNLRPDAQSTLQADATTLRQILSQYPTYKLTVEGFCDERGSDEYNLALGDSRAEKAREFLETLGLPATQLGTVSFGKERPVCTEHSEACWQKNRRAHITPDQKAS